MAETTSEKKTTAKKTTAKKSAPKAEEVAVETAQETTVVEEPVAEEQPAQEPHFQDSGDVMFGNPEDYMEPVNEAGPSNEFEETPVDKSEPDAEQALEEVKIEEKPVSEEVNEDAQVLAAGINEFEEAKKKLEEKVEKLNEPDEAEAAIRDQIKEIEAIKAKTEKVVKKYSNYQISNSWNGQIQDW